MQQVEMAAKAANAHDFIMNLPDVGLFCLFLMLNLKAIIY